MPFDEDNVFIFLSIVELGESYNSALALTEQFFFLDPDTRNESIKAWIELLEGCLHEEFVEELSEEVEPGEMAIIISDHIVENRPIPDNVIEFKTDDK